MLHSSLRAKYFGSLSLSVYKKASNPISCSSPYCGSIISYCNAVSNAGFGEDSSHKNKKPKGFYCMNLRAEDAGSYVELCGKLEELIKNKLYLFMDRTGTIPIKIKNKDRYISKILNNIELSSPVTLVGYLMHRGKTEHPSYDMGDLELILEKITSFTEKKNSVTEANTKTPVHWSGLTRVTNEEAARCGNILELRHFYNRTHTCGELNLKSVGEKVILCGWVDYKHEEGKSLKLTDGYGSVIVIPNLYDEELMQKFQTIHVNFMLNVKGLISDNPDNYRECNAWESYPVHVLAESITVIKKVYDYSVTTKNDEHVKKETEDVKNSVVEVKEEQFMLNSNKYTLRSHNCGQLNESHIGKNVRLMGWVKYSRLNKFIILNDKYGSVQLIIPGSRKDLQEYFKEVTLESVISITGTVSSRPKGQQKPEMSTGMIEVILTDMNIISKSGVLPFCSKGGLSNEFIRLQYRYLDLRQNENMQAILSTRSNIIHKMRKFLIESVGFTEVETPTLFKRTPGGAQEFIVPTRKKGDFYSLVQSPQQFKQLLMIGGVDRYFQLARCYRDEDVRKDRQPEFTQLDIEMSFCDRNGVMKLVEDILEFIWPECLPSLVTPFPRMTYQEAMDLYATDKPNIMYDLRTYNITELLLDVGLENVRNLDSTVFTVNDFAAHVVVSRQEQERVSPSERLGLQNKMKQNHPEVSLSVVPISDIVHNTDIKLSRIFPYKLCNRIGEITNFTLGDTLYIALGSKMSVIEVQNNVREAITKKLANDNLKEGKFSFLWVTDFPLFEEVDGQLKSLHHPFTQPHPDDLHFLNTDPLKARGLHYDLVLNGNEIGGGSIRINDPVMQRQILENILKLDSSELSHLLEALGYGAPPHGGIALGIDRLISILCGTETIRDVIAFPKNGFGRDVLGGSPCGVPEADKKLYHICEIK